jgi:hypothetical protein
MDDAWGRILRVIDGTALRENVASSRETINSHLESMPNLNLIENSKQKIDGYAEKGRSHLLFGSDYIHTNFPYAALLSRSHGYLFVSLSALLTYFPLRSEYWKI